MSLEILTVIMLGVLGTAIVIIGVPVVLGIGLEAYKRHVAFKEKRLELMADRTAEKAAQYVAQVERLEQRMRVLERIATDKGVDLATEIESLRDEPAALSQPGLKNEELN